VPVIGVLKWILRKQVLSGDREAQEGVCWRATVKTLKLFQIPCQPRKF